ncbi:MAG: hypothetical protein ACJATA_000903 [Sphingobacteriales bacterium]|jgi:hypothetical protein
MQKFLSSVFFLSFILGTVISANAQSIQITYVSDTIEASPFEDAVAKIYVKNSGEGTVEVLAERKEAQIQDGQDVYFCWAENCYGPNVIVSPGSTKMEAGDSTDYFKGYLAHYKIPGISRVKYCFYDTTNNADSACAWVTYEFAETATGVKEARIIPYGLNVYPNPMTTVGNIAFDLPSATNVTVNVFNILGERIQQENLGVLPAGAYKENLDISTLTKGIYLVKVTFNNMELIRKITVK